jgi:uncharacterized membrane protein
MTAPFEQTINSGDEVFLGTIGPGQTIELRIDPIVTTGGIYGQGGQYDIAQVVYEPKGWTSEQSLLYQKPLQIKITADKNAPPGEYYADIAVINENNGEELGNVSFRVKMNVTWDVLGLDVSPASVVVGPGQPAQYAITVTNKGAASDTYTVSSTGVKRWEFVKPIYVPARSSKMVEYEITGDEEVTYNPTIKVESVSSPNIHDERNVTFIVRSDLIGDYKAANHGTLLFPVFEAPIYGLAGFIGTVVQTIQSVL